MTEKRVFCKLKFKKLTKLHFLLKNNYVRKNSQRICLKRHLVSLEKSSIYVENSQVCGFNRCISEK